MTACVATSVPPFSAALRMRESRCVVTAVPSGCSGLPRGPKSWISVKAFTASVVVTKAGLLERALVILTTSRM